jgi:hypothetical protein
MKSELKITDVIQSQYHAALSMLQQSIENCPESLWTDPEPVNTYWQVAFHALFYVHLYLQPTEEAFRPWPKFRDQPETSLSEPELGEPLTQAEVLEYLAFCRGEVDRLVGTLDLAGASGFSWLPFNKLELQFYNMRHVMQHTGELSGRLFEQEGIEINWVGMKR